MQSNPSSSALAMPGRGQISTEPPRYTRYVGQTSGVDVPGSYQVMPNPSRTPGLNGRPAVPYATPYDVGSPGMGMAQGLVGTLGYMAYESQAGPPGQSYSDQMIARTGLDPYEFSQVPAEARAKLFNDLARPSFQNPQEIFDEFKKKYGSQYQQPYGPNFPKQAYGPEDKRTGPFQPEASPTGRSNPWTLNPETGKPYPPAVLEAAEKQGVDPFFINPETGLPWSERPAGAIDPDTGYPYGEALPFNPFPGFPGGAISFPAGNQDLIPARWRTTWVITHSRPSAEGVGEHDYFVDSVDPPTVTIENRGPQPEAWGPSNGTSYIMGIMINGVEVASLGNGNSDNQGNWEVYGSSVRGPVAVGFSAPTGEPAPDPIVTPLGNPLNPAQPLAKPSPGYQPAPAPANPSQPKQDPKGQPKPAPKPTKDPSPTPTPAPAPKPNPFAPGMMPFMPFIPMPGFAPGMTPSGRPGGAPQSNPGAFTSSSRQTNPGSSPGSNPNPNPRPNQTTNCSYREDEVTATPVDYVVVTPIGRVKTPRVIPVHEKMADATKLQFEVLGQMRESLDKIEKNTKISKVMQIVTMATTIHNALMLSREIAETLGNVTSMMFTAVGRMSGAVGESDFVNVNEILGGEFNKFMEGVLGKELWSGTKESWLKASRIYQSGANIVNSVRDIADSSRDIGEFTAQNVSKIGNALRKFRVVGWDAYGTMDENARAKSKFFRNMDKAIDKGERLENAASSLGGVAGNVLSIQDEVKDIKENRDAFKKGIEEWGKKDAEKQKKDEAASKVDEGLEEKDLK